MIPHTIKKFRTILNTFQTNLSYLMELLVWTFFSTESCSHSPDNFVAARILTNWDNLLQLTTTTTTQWYPTSSDSQWFPNINSHSSFIAWLWLDTSDVVWVDKKNIACVKCWIGCVLGAIIVVIISAICNFKWESS